MTFDGHQTDTKNINNHAKSKRQVYKITSTA